MVGPGRGEPAPDRTLRRLLVARVVAVVGLLASATFARLRLPGGPGTDPLFWLIAVAFGLTVFHAATLRRAGRSRWIVDAQMAADACVLTGAVVVTGGVQSPLSPLYVLPVVAAAVVQYRRGGLLVATMTTSLYAGVIATQYARAGVGAGAAVFGVDPAALPPVNEAIFTLGLNGLGFGCVGWLTGYLADRLRLADERLEQASTLIADLRAFNQCIIDSLTGGLATSDPAGQVLTFNRAAELITGHAADTVRTRPVGEVLQLPSTLVEALPGLVDSGRGRRVDVEYVTAAGRHIDLGLTAAPLMGADGRVGFLFTFQDVTEHRRREREAQTEKRLAAIGEMAAGIAHEIRNPLASMAGSIQVLRQDLQLSAEQARLMDIVLRESERLNDIIRNFLAYARPGRRTSQPVDLERLARDAVALLGHSAERGTSHRLEVAATPDTPRVLGDEAQLRQVIWNLATNALKAMPDGGTLEIRVEPAPDGRVLLLVRDTGVGIPASELDRVFEPFRSGNKGGTGLGLAIVHRIVSDCSGAVDVESAPGGGTTIRVFLPAATVAETAIALTA